jgi:hypothetical protein
LHAFEYALTQAGSPNPRRPTPVSPPAAPSPAAKVRKGKEARPATPALAADLSAALRKLLLVEINDLGSSDDAALWAHRSIGRKNTLTASDTQQVEERFRAKLMILTAPIEDHPSHEARSATAETATEVTASPHPAPTGIDKSVLTLPEPRRIRDREDLRSVMRNGCLVCGRAPLDAHLLRFTQKRALGRKVSDEFTVPLCRGHHRELRRWSDEAAWWTKLGLEPITAARTLWLESHPLP